MFLPAGIVIDSLKLCPSLITSPLSALSIASWRVPSVTVVYVALATIGTAITNAMMIETSPHSISLLFSCFHLLISLLSRCYKVFILLYHITPPIASFYTYHSIKPLHLLYCFLHNQKISQKNDKATHKRSCGQPYAVLQLLWIL